MDGAPARTAAQVLHVGQSSKRLRVRNFGEMCFQSNESSTARGHCQAPHTFAPSDTINVTRGMAAIGVIKYV